jgi:mannose-6-phosphate isomerase
MTIEQATLRAVAKPWGRSDLRPWGRGEHGDERIGEIWFGRADGGTKAPGLLLKLLFTSEPLSIQVHPDDAQARASGEPHGKTEAWYILAADPGARVALGTVRSLSTADLRASVEDGSVAAIVLWHPAHAGDVFVVPAGTIHAIGAGLAIVEVQQRSDTTYRLFDHGRERDLQVEKAIAIARLHPATPAAPAIRLSDARVVLVVTPYFVLERVEIGAASSCQIEARQETWALVVDGTIEIAGIAAGIGEGVFLDDESALLTVGARDAVLLIAYARDCPDLDLIGSLATTPSALRQRPAPTVVPPRAGSVAGSLS